MKNDTPTALSPVTETWHRDIALAPDSIVNALYIVATPIGNLLDISARAVQVLNGVDLIAAEDTRHSEKLMQHYHISTPLIAYHDHGSDKQQERIFSRLQKGQSVALVSDAGTPLISDPGYRLVAEARQMGFAIVPVPGACALITALSASGLPTDRFTFEGFPPAKAAARIDFYTSMAEFPHTLIFYEAPHRIEASLAAMVSVFGAEREAVVAREISKTYETFLTGTLADIAVQVGADSNQRRGELVVMVAGYRRKNDDDLSAHAQTIMLMLLDELPIKKAAALTAKITGDKKNKLYQWALNNDAGKTQ